MKTGYYKFGFTVICCIAVVTTIACGSKVSSEKDSKPSYVIQEIITSEPSKLQEAVEEGTSLELEEALTKNLSGIAKGDIINSEGQELSDASSANPEDLSKGNVQPVLGSVYKPSSVEVIDKEMVELINSMPVKSVIKGNMTNAATLAECFTSEKISPTIFDRMENKSFSEGCTTDIKNLRYIRVLHYGFDGDIHIGELIVNQMIETDILEIFKELFDVQYPIEQMVLIDDYDADDNLSMEANNSSCFNFRMIDGTTSLSKHALGLAIDINPLYNPYIRTVNDKLVILPSNGIEYVDRSLECEYYIQKDDVIYKAFIKRGFTWGGDWTSSLDYQHFQKVFS